MMRYVAGHGYADMPSACLIGCFAWYLLLPPPQSAIHPDSPGGAAPFSPISQAGIAVVLRKKWMIDTCLLS